MDCHRPKKKKEPDKYNLTIGIPRIILIEQEGMREFYCNYPRYNDSIYLHKGTHKVCLNQRMVGLYELQHEEIDNG